MLFPALKGEKSGNPVNLETINHKITIIVKRKYKCKENFFKMLKNQV